jgi:plastocyanin
MLVIAAMIGASACSGSGDSFGVVESSDVSSADFNYEIPVGAGEQLDAGTPLEILPAELRAKVGQAIEIVNLDDRGHLVGPWFVGAGETLRQEFTSAGEFIGICTVHPSGEIKVIVEDA